MYFRVIKLLAARWSQSWFYCYIQTSLLINCDFWWQWIEFLLFACLLLGVCIIFSIMAHFYTYVDPDQMVKHYVGNSDKTEDDDANETETKRNGMALKETSMSTKM